MADYTTRAQIIKKMGQAHVERITDGDGDGSTDDDPIDEAIDDISSLIDSYLSARYSLPLATVPNVLSMFATDGVLYRLAETTGVPTKEQRQRYEDMMTWLRAVAKGTVDLGLEDPPASTGSKVRTTGATREWTRSKAQVF